MKEKLKALNKPIRFGNIGSGAMGMGVYYQSIITPNIECSVLSDLDINKAIKCAETFNKAYRIVENLNELNDCIDQSILAITDNSNLITECELLEAVCESSSSIEDAAHYCINTLESGKDLILMNAEVDLAFGHYFKKIADKNNLIVTSCDGDQHSVLKRMINDIELWGLETILVGNIKGFLDIYSNPDKIKPEADIRKLDYKMATAYTDGSKLNIEMALIANNLSLRTQKPGMTGYYTKSVHDVLGLFNLKEIKNSGNAIIDYIIGAEPGGGVFVVAYCDNPYQQFMLNYYKLGNGPFYLFYRPYHLCHLEFTRTLIEGVIDRSPLLQPIGKRKTDVVTYAKKDLSIGESLDGLGGYSCYGKVENLEEQNIGLPILLSDGIKLKRNVRKDERISLLDIEYDKSSFLFNLYSNSMDTI